MWQIFATANLNRPSLFDAVSYNYYILSTFRSSDYETFSEFEFWVEGIIQSVLSILGIIANFISAMILSK